MRHSRRFDVPKTAFQKDGPRKGDTPLKVLQRPNAIDLSGGVLDFEPTDTRRKTIAELLGSPDAARDG